MMRAVSAEDFPVRLGKQVSQTGPSLNPRILTKKEDAGQSFYPLIPPGHNEDPSACPTTRKPQRRTSLQKMEKQQFYLGSQKTHVPTRRFIISRPMALFSNHTRKTERRTLLGMVKYIQNLFRS